MTSDQRIVERIVEIQEMQESFRKRAEEACEKGDFTLYFFLEGAANLLESDKLFIASSELLETYRTVLKDAVIEVNGMKWPMITLFIPSTSTETLSSENLS